jgi:hypothetical protein
MSLSQLLQSIEKVETLTERTVEYKLSGAIIIKLLQDAGVTFPNLPGDVNAFVTVPGGGDWSNKELDIDDDSPLIVRVKTIERKVE